MLFKILHGDTSRISTNVTPFHEGYCYVTHDGYMYIDMNIGTETNANNQRIKLNAKDAETLTGASLSTILNSSDIEIPTSKVVLDALNKKQNTITGAATSIIGTNLAANQVLVSNTSGKVSVSSVTSTELGYLDGATSNIQTQLNNKASAIHTHASSDIILTDTATGVQYQLCMTNGKLNVIQI